MAYQPSANVKIQKVNSSNFNKLEKAYSDWLRVYDQQQGADFGVDAAYESRSQLNSDVKYFKKQLDALVSILKQEGFDTNKMLKDLKENYKLGAINSYLNKK